MSKKEFARVACFVALLYGAIQLSRDREAGPLTTGFRLLLVAGGTVGLVWLGFPGKGGEESEQTSAGAAPAAAAPIVEPASTQWMGNPEGNRRRLTIILIVFCVIVAGFATVIIATL